MYKMNESGRNKLYNVSDMCHTTLVFDMACASTFECHCTTFPSRPVLDIFTQKSTYVTHLLLCAMREKEKKKTFTECSDNCTHSHSMLEIPLV